MMVATDFRLLHWVLAATFRFLFDRNLIFGHKLHIDTPYRGKRFWTHQIPTSCLLTLLIFMHIERTFCICPFLVAFFSATIDGRSQIFGHKLFIGTPYRGKRFLTRQIPTSCLPKSRGIISEHQLTVHLVILLLFVVRGDMGEYQCTFVFYDNQDRINQAVMLKGKAKMEL